MVDLFIRFIVPAAYSLLPERMHSPAATAFLLTAGLQESRFEHRRQIRGPARSFFQFESIGVWGVLEHAHAGPILREALTQLRYNPDSSAAEVHAAMEHNDILATCVARCLLWTDPRPLPSKDDPVQSWLVYLATWRPGKPHPQTWSDHYAIAWGRVQQPLDGLRA